MPKFDELFHTSVPSAAQQRVENLVGGRFGIQQQVEDLLLGKLGVQRQVEDLLLGKPDSYLGALQSKLQHEDKLRREAALYDFRDPLNFETRYGPFHEHKPFELLAKTGAWSSIDETLRAAELARTYSLPSILEPYRTPVESLAAKLFASGTPEIWREPHYVAVFAGASAMSDMLKDATRIDRTFNDAARSFNLLAVPAALTVAGYGGLLDAAGLSLPHWPRVRLLTKAEKRRQFKARLRKNAEPSHLKRAKSLVHRYEVTLREVLDDVMAEVFGEDWPEQRLPLCNCGDLLGKWRTRGGDVLDHADYVHYARIMSHPDHFSAVFEAGFERPDELYEIMVKAGKLRAASHHHQPFTTDDLRNLRLVWRTIETGLLALTGDYVVEN